MSFVKRNSCGVSVVGALALERDGAWSGSRHTNRHLAETLQDIALVGCPGVVKGASREHFADAILGEVLIMGQLGEVVETPPLRLGVI